MQMFKYEKVNSFMQVRVYERHTVSDGGSEIEVYTTLKTVMVSYSTAQTHLHVPAVPLMIRYN